MTTETILKTTSILSKESFDKSKTIWKELSKNKNATFEHHVFYFLISSQDPKSTFKKSFSPLKNPNKVFHANNDGYINLKAKLYELTQKDIVALKFIEPWLSVLLSEDEYEIKGYGQYKNVKSSSEIFNTITENAKSVLASLNKEGV